MNIDKLDAEHSHGDVKYSVLISQENGIVKMQFSSNCKECGADKIIDEYQLNTKLLLGILQSHRATVGFYQNNILIYMKSVVRAAGEGYTEPISITVKSLDKANKIIERDIFDKNPHVFSKYDTNDSIKKTSIDIKYAGKKLIITENAEQEFDVECEKFGIYYNFNA